MLVSWSKITVLFSLGLVLCLLGGLLIPIFPLILRLVVKAQIVLKPGSESFQRWQKPPVDIYLQFYFFNITNPVDFENGSMATLEQIGPYTYREVREKYNIIWNEDNTVTYKDEFLYFFDRNKSVGPEDDKFNFLNIPLIAIVEKVEAMKQPEKEIAELIVKAYEKKEPLVTNHKVKDILWGYVDPLMTQLKLLHFTPDDTFGLFYKKNASDDGLYSVLTGETNLDLFGTVFTWNKSTTLNYWTTSYCNMINGTDGTIFHPFIQKTDKLYIYTTDLCRSIYCTFEKEVIINNILAYKFTAPKEVFENSSINGDNTGFCNPECLGSGVISVNACKDGAPIILSSPHFYLGDPKFINAVDGLNPNKEEHETFMFIEPTSGLILKAMKRLQINVNVKNWHNITQFKTVSPVFLPIVWLNESVELDEDDLNMIKSRMLIPIRIVSFFEIALITMGLLVLLSIFVYIVITTWIKSKSDDKQEILNDECFAERNEAENHHYE